ncbi:Platelet endothelial aggregation receptor 1 [Labeo rohita]|uniref:Platelet endothelial aggregation receptor 1 n=1 Tax=Labeo rohita TaxID=84645 RepID=A0ABQ8LXK6_LABRO|nr:Platelet endothelial aggregation receptor 1 [Labeo rohita]
MKTAEICVVLFVLGCVCELSLSLDPRDPNVCSLWESFTTSVKESYTQPFDQVKYEETCFEPWNANKCTRHRITNKTLYRQVVKMDYRRRYQCCRGFYESRNKCVPRCTKECVHGRCVAPDRCQCESGWRGEDCSSLSDPRTLQLCPEHVMPNTGVQAAGSAVSAKTGGVCDVIKGSCQCPAGYTGEHCQDPCTSKSYGQGCLQQCQCGTGGFCNKTTGECVCRDGFTGTLCEEPCIRSRCSARCPCQNGGICQGRGVCLCPPGWMGAVCTERCPPGRYGTNCAKECLCHNGGHCDPEKGQCQCDAGYTGERCNEECPVGTYGEDCKGVCDCANGARCYNIHGGCLCEPGFKGQRCDHRMCPDGTYGMHCEHRCLCNSQNTLSCHPLKGECTCQPGWAGLYCNETCAHGHYGNGCLEPCLCVNGGVCDTVTGKCHCAPGYRGQHCENLCEDGFYGKDCLSPCTCVNSIACSPIDGTCFCKEEGTWGPSCNFTCQCANGASCHPADGSCKCTAGWRGPSCDEPCPIGTFGPGCQHKCDCLHDEGCESVTGQCLCLPGWTGLRCTEQCPEGTWGLQCNQTCSCLNSATCQAHTGTCLCKPGFWGAQCQHMPDCLERGAAVSVHHVYMPPPPAHLVGMAAIVVMSASAATMQHVITRMVYASVPPDGLDQTALYTGTFGTNCAQTCSCPPNHSCDPHTGDCVCVPGPGEDCKPEQELSMMVPVSPVEKDSWGAIAGIVVLVILVVLLLAVLLLYRRRQQDKQSNTPVVSFSSTRTNRPPLPHLPNNQDRAIKNMERERRGLFAADTNATLPPGWKHQEPPKDPGAFGIDRSYSYSATLGKHYNKELKDSCVAVSSSSLNSENPYATIKDLPGLPPCPPESSYMEMKSAVPRERSYTEISPPVMPPSTLSCREHCSLGNAVEQEPQNHYDLPINSHIPGHYDLPPVRRPPSPSPRRLPH